MIAITTYKKTQGRPTRQIALCILAGLLSWLLITAITLFQPALNSALEKYKVDWRPGHIFWLNIWLSIIGVAFVISVASLNRPRWADFLISVQAEVDKVTWPSSAEVRKATVVVLALLVTMAVVIFAFDAIWQWVFEMIGFLELRKPPVDPSAKI